MATIQPSSTSKEEANDKDPDSELNNLLIVTGNGFDLACGLPTRYCDFFKSLINNNFGKSNAQFCDILDSGDYKLISQNYVSTYCMTTWEYYLYFEYRKVRNQDGLLWFDVEEKLTDFFKKDGFWDKAKPYIDMVKPSSDRNAVVLSPLTEWNIYSVALYALFYTYHNSKNFVLYDLLKKKVIYENFYRALEEELGKLEEKFKNYLNGLVELNNGTYGKKRDELLDEIVSSVEKKIGKCSNPVICTFNYTKTKSKSKYDIQFVHGDINHPIFGIDDSIANTKNELNVFTKKYKRINPLDKSVKCPSYADVLGDAKKIKYNIAFYGLSFAKTDDYDFNHILDHFDPDNTKIFLCASDNKYLDDMKVNFRRVFENKFPKLSHDEFIDTHKIILINVANINI